MCNATKHMVQWQWKIDQHQEDALIASHHLETINAQLENLEECVDLDNKSRIPAVTQKDFEHDNVTDISPYRVVCV